MSKTKPAPLFMLVISCALGVVLSNFGWGIVASFIAGGLFAHLDIWIRGRF